MRKFSVIMLVAFLLYACGSSSEDVREVETESRDFSTSQIQKLKIDTENGNIENFALGDDEIHVVLEKWATGNDAEEARSNIDDIKVSIEEDNSSRSLNIDVEIPNSATTDYGCNISADTPASVELDLESRNGTITIEDSEGKTKLRTSNGKIIVKNHRGDLDGETSNGEIDVEIILPDDGKCKLKTSNGTITISIPSSTSADIKASTSNGRIEVDHPDVEIDEVDDKEFKGKIGDGDGEIELETMNGNIVIKQL